MLQPLTPHSFSFTGPKTVVLLASAREGERSDRIRKAISLFEAGREPAQATDDLTIVKDPKGKPFFASYPACLSISHSGPYEVIAISDMPIGIDLQEHRAMDFEKLAKRFFHPEEIDFIRRGKGTDEASRFYTVWCAKEAYVKYTGTGIDGNFGSFSIFALKETISLLQIDLDQTLAICQNDPLPILF